MDFEYIQGMFDVMASHYSGEEEMELKDIFKFPKPIEYKSEEDRLPHYVKHMQLRHAHQWKQIEKRLTGITDVLLKRKVEKTICCEACSYKCTFLKD